MGTACFVTGGRAATLGVTLHEGVTRHHRWGRSVPLHSTAQNYFLQLRVNVQSSPRQNLVKKKKKKDTRLLIPVPEVTKQTERRPYFTRSGFPRAGFLDRGGQQGGGPAGPTPPVHRGPGRQKGSAREGSVAFPGRRAAWPCLARSPAPSEGQDRAALPVPSRWSHGPRGQWAEQKRLAPSGQRSAPSGDPRSAPPPPAAAPWQSRSGGVPTTAGQSRQAPGTGTFLLRAPDTQQMLITRETQPTP